MIKNHCLILFLVLLNFLNASYAYFVTVDAHAEECFFEKADKGTKLSLMFEISEGGFLDIDVRIIGPDDAIIYQGVRESSGKYTFSAQSAGVYTYCFSNQMSTMTPKVVMFNMDVGEPPKEVHEGDKESADHDKMENIINDLTLSLTSVKHEQEYMTVRDRIHRSINESTNSRVMLWSVFEALVLVTMTIGQVYYLRRFFEVRRVV